MSSKNIPVVIGVEQSDGKGSEQIGAFVTSTPEYMAALDRARDRVAELNTEYPNDSTWYIYVSDEHGHKKIMAQE